MQVYICRPKSEIRGVDCCDDAVDASQMFRSDRLARRSPAMRSFGERTCLRSILADLYPVWRHTSTIEMLRDGCFDMIKETVSIALGSVAWRLKLRKIGSSPQNIEPSDIACFDMERHNVQGL
ncbi:hypothetical protein ACJ73_00154 [Blastomyces percursus]|uniref:Uncharacterized protein n=1 Tax=Blastomyces percursus TaxID=1658174 RepID=A0A1J9RIS8_9EURO|nr:hypothetical protein ACJ73_00154 [Blastomyces percursus]